MIDLFNENSTLKKLTNWIERFVYLQFLLILYTLKGFVFGGFFPSIAALYASIRLLLIDEGNIDIKTFFKKEYRENFKTSNMIGYGLFIINIVLIINLQSAQLIQSKIGFTFVFISYGLIIFMIVLTSSIWAFLAHFNLPLKQLIKHSIAILLLNPLHTGLILVVFTIFVWTAIRFAILLPFILISIYIYGITLILSHALDRTKKLQEQK